jgi:2-oxoglutarate ferredoxin oxidoreductase subunit alpha
VQDFIETHKMIYVVEMNRDGQMHKLLQLEYPAYATRILSVAKHDGLPMNARWVKEDIQAKEKMKHE